MLQLTYSVRQVSLPVSRLQDGSLAPRQDWWAARSADVAVEAYGMDVVLSCNCYNR